MSNGETSDMPTKKGSKMSAISKKLNYLDEAVKRNLNLSSEIRAKLLSTEPKEVSEAEKTPREAGQLNNIRDQIQDLLNLLNLSNEHLASVNQEI